MKRVVIFSVVFVLTMLIATRLIDSNDTESLFIKLLISGLVASIAFWFVTVRDNQKDIDNS